MIGELKIWNQSAPITLKVSTFLAYYFAISTLFSLAGIPLFGFGSGLLGVIAVVFSIIGLGGGLLLLLALALMVGWAVLGYGIANAKRTAYKIARIVGYVAVGGAVVAWGLNMFRVFSADSLSATGTFFAAAGLTLDSLLGVVLDAAFLAGLLHPISKEYEGFWFE
jgi:hypothetical protein